MYGNVCLRIHFYVQEVFSESGFCLCLSFRRSCCYCSRCSRYHYQYARTPDAIDPSPFPACVETWNLAVCMDGFDDLLGIPT